MFFLKNLACKGLTIIYDRIGFQTFQMTCLYQTLVDIEVVTSSSTFQASLVIVSRSLGSIVGAMILGRLYEKLHHNLLLGVFCLLAASVTLPIAYVQSIYGTYALAAIAGVAIGAKDTGG